VLHENERRVESQGMFKGVFEEVLSQFKLRSLRRNTLSNYAECPFVLSGELYTLEAHVGLPHDEPIIRLAMIDTSRNWPTLTFNGLPFSLSEKEILKLQYEFFQEGSTIVITPYAFTRPEYTGRGFMTGLVLNSRQVVDYLISQNADYFKEKEIFIEIEDVAKDQRTGKYSGFSSNLAKSMGFTYFNDLMKWKLKYAPFNPTP